MTEMPFAEARAECLSLLMAYCVTQDSSDADAFAALFAEAGEWHKSDGETVVGRERIRDAARRMFDARLANGIATLHMLTSAHAVPGEGGGVACTSYALVYRVREAGKPLAGSPAPSAIMTYETSFVRAAEGWRILRYQGVNHLGKSPR